MLVHQSRRLLEQIQPGIQRAQSLQRQQSLPGQLEQNLPKLDGWHRRSEI